jgi:hypothetical protein
MSQILQTIEKLVRLGANVTISREANLTPQNLESIVRIAAGTGVHITIYGEGHLPQTLETLARVGSKDITIVI